MRQECSILATSQQKCYAGLGVSYMVLRLRVNTNKRAAPIHVPHYAAPTTYYLLSTPERHENRTEHSSINGLYKINPSVYSYNE